jgi:peptidoglycan/xylan/chitin deacetylase (PgdA/CDA1 family)
MFVERASFLFRHLIKAVWNMGGKEKKVYLTFDDGPTPEVTPKVLEILNRYGVKATFFCVGENVRHYPDLFEQIKQHKHAVGNHTMCHTKGFGVTFDDYVKEVKEADLYIQSKYFRPPYGRITPKQLIELQKTYKIIMWDVITRDYNPKLKPEKMVKIVKHFTRNGSIIVFHDSKKASTNLLSSLPTAIEWLQEQGFEFEIFN